MVKTPPDELLEAIADDFHTFLRRGVRIEQVIGSAHPDLDINDIETLLRIHFALTHEPNSDDAVGVVDFVRRLESRIRSIKTTTTRETTERRGEIRGHIDWQQTAKRRARAGRLDEPLFVSNQPEEHYNIDENLVLKRLLTVIRDILYDDLEYVLERPEKYSWASDWTSSAGDESLESTAEEFKRVFERNIYLQRIEVEENAVTDRTVEDVKRSRSPFYREAANLLDNYRQLMRYELDSEEARTILNQTLVTPEETEVLFELYWLFRILSLYDDVQYNLLSDQRANQSVVASWTQDGFRYRVSHDSTGTGLIFNESLASNKPDPDGYLYRTDAVLRRWQDLSEELLDIRSSGSLWGGRPDIVVERFDSDGDQETLDRVFVGEVKYTRDTQYAAKGLRELLEYMAYARRANERSDYVESADDVLDSVNVSGLLFVDDLDMDIESPDRITVVQYPEAVNQVI